MIALMRKLIHSNVYKLFLWVFLFMMAFGSGVAIINFGENKNWVMKIFKQTLTEQKFKSMLKTAQQQQEMYRQKGIMLMGKNIPKETVQAAISGLLAIHAMDDLGLKVPSSYVNEQVQNQLQQLPAQFFNAHGQLDHEAFSRAFAPYTIEDFISDIEIEAKNKLLYGLVESSVYVSEFETILQYNVEFADKSYGYMVLPYQKFLAQARSSMPSDETLLKFYKKPQIADIFKTLEKRAGSVWTFSPENFITTISDTEAKSFYEKNKTQRYVLEPSQMQVRLLLIKSEIGKESEAKKTIEELSQKAQQDPSQFEKLVRQFSQDSKTAAHGGLTEFFSKNDKKFESIVIETAFEILTDDGQISVPIKVEKGFMLIQRAKKNPAKYKDFKSVEAEIKKDLRTEKFKKRFLQDATRVANEAKYNPQALDKFAERYKGSKSELSLDVRKPGIEHTHLFKIEQSRYTAFIDKDQGIILHCSMIEKSKLPDLSDVKTKLLGQYFESKAFELLEEELNKAFADARRMNLQEVADKYGAKIQKATFDYNNGKVEQSTILKEQEVQAKIKGLQHVGAITIIKTKVDGILIRLDSIESKNKSLFQEQKEHLSKVMFYTKLYQIKEGFIASLYRTAKLNNKIEIKNELLQMTKEV